MKSKALCQLQNIEISLASGNSKQYFVLYPTFDKHGSETMFPVLPKFGKHCLDSYLLLSAVQCETCVFFQMELNGVKSCGE